MRTGKTERKTSETQVFAQIELDGNKEYEIKTEAKFLKHMLEQLACHSGFNLKIEAISLDGDMHHLVEDTAIALGKAFRDALGDKKGINRYGQFILPMDEALVLCAVDICGRSFSKTDLYIDNQKISDMDAILIPHFFSSFAQNADLTLHIKQLDGKDPHHIAEAAFKAFARALKSAVTVTSSNLPSTKGCL